MHRRLPNKSDSPSTPLWLYVVKKTKKNKKTFLKAFFFCFGAAFLRPMEEGEQPTRGPHFVGKKEELIKTKRTVVTAGGRDILVIHHQEVFYALDCYCYREYNSDISYKYHAIKCKFIVTR